MHSSESNNQIYYAMWKGIMGNPDDTVQRNKWPNLIIVYLYQHSDTNDAIWLAQYLAILEISNLI